MSSFRQLMMRNKGGGVPTLNAEIVGTLSVSEEFVVSGFGGSNFMYIPTDFTLTSNDTVELNIKAKRTGTGTGWCTLATTVYSVRNDSGKFETGASREWEIYYDTCHVQGSPYYYSTQDIWYWYKFVINNSTKIATMYGSTTGAFAGEEVTITSGNFTDVVSSWYFRLGSDGGSSSSIGYGNFWYGLIDMTETNLKINNQIVWQGVI